MEILIIINKGMIETVVSTHSVKVNVVDKDNASVVDAPEDIHEEFDPVLIASSDQISGLIADEIKAIEIKERSRDDDSENH